MNDERSFDLLRGQSAPPATDGSGIQALHQCSNCGRIWLQDGKAVILDLTDEQIRDLAHHVAADLTHLPQTLCRICLWRIGGGSISIDEYDRGEGFGLCWEMPRPQVVHAISTLLSPACGDGPPDVLTQPEKLRTVLRAARQAPPPTSMLPVPPALCHLQASMLPPGFGQEGTGNWAWRGWTFPLECPPLGGRATVTFLLALPPTEPLTMRGAFRIWRGLLEVTLLGSFPSTGS